MGQAPQRFNKVIVTGDITSPKFIRTGSTVDSVLLGNGSARAVASIKTDTASLSNRINTKEPANSNIQAHISSTSNPHSVTKSQVGLGSVDNTSDTNKPISTATQTALNGKQAAGTYSTDIHSNITALNAVSGTNTGDETLTSIKTKLGAASSSNSGYLLNTDWSTFNGKQNALTFGNLTSSVASMSVAGGTGAVIGSGVQLSIPNASTSTDGILTAANFNVFNNKQPPGSYLTSLTGAVLLNPSSAQSGSINLTGSATFSSAVQTTGITPTNLTTNYIPMKSSGVLIDSPLSIVSGITTITTGNQASSRFNIINTSGHGFSLVAGQTNESQDGFSIYDTSLGTTRLTITSGGNVGIGYSSGTEITNNKLAVNGKSYFNDMVNIGYAFDNPDLTGNQLAVNGNIYSSNIIHSEGQMISDDLITGLGDIKAYGNFIKNGGTSSQFLKADGSVDSNTYINVSDILSGFFSGVGVTATISGATVTVYTVSIGGTMPNTSYKVSVTPTSIIGGSAAHYVSNKTTTTFDFILVGGIFGNITLDWVVFK